MREPANPSRPSEQERRDVKRIAKFDPEAARALLAQQTRERPQHYVNRGVRFPARHPRY